MDFGGSGGDEPFALEWLSTEVLAGVTQRLSNGAKVQAERVNGRLAAVTRALAWRHCSSLSLSVCLSSSAPLHLRAGGLSVELSGSDGDAGAVARFLMQRARVVELQAVSQLSDVEAAAGDEGLTGKQAQMRALATALCSPDVQLRALLLEGTAAELFGGDAPAAALFRRHAATLEQAALGLRKAGSGELYSAVRACTALRRFTGRLLTSKWHCLPYYSVGHSEAISALLVGWQPQSCAITLTNAADGVFMADETPMLQVEELHLHNVHLANVRNVLPKLKVLRMDIEFVGASEYEYWCATSYIGIYFERDDTNLSLSIEIVVRPCDTNLLTRLRQFCEGLDVHIECFDAAVCADAGVAPPAPPPPPLPPQFAHNGQSSVFTLERRGERRQLLLAFYERQPPADP